MSGRPSISCNESKDGYCAVKLNEFLLKTDTLLPDYCWTTDERIWRTNLTNYHSLWEQNQYCGGEQLKPNKTNDDDFSKWPMAPHGTSALAVFNSAFAWPDSHFSVINPRCSQSIPYIPIEILSQTLQQFQQTSTCEQPILTELDVSVHFM